ncbi:TlpA family protein disulfide reductase [Cognatitamlana onchidii]|uniref:TlpA family protein disulfide reductase n=1 Tax=Cognatitamlana onchidii TaxID=2562860 RepID=UPI0010A68ED1|nr:TlpA disulfide reductase family protein [Algibacter onchidii]
MKKIISILCLGLITLYAYSQRSIENPEYGVSTIPGEITKIEILDTTTVLHFKLKKLPWGYFHIPKESYIQNLNGGNKQFVTKVTGATFKRNYFPESGEVTYQLYFAPLDKTVKTIDFGVAKERGWIVHDIVIQEDKNSFLVPKELRGNWLLANGSNRWDYGFNSKYAIVDGAIWTYKSIEKKGKKYAIVLEREKKERTIYAKLGKDGTVTFGKTPKALESYSLTKIFNPNFKFEDDVEFENVVFSPGYATYSGMIKGFSDRLKQKTAMIHVNNAFKGGQESHLIKINNDGSFRLEFPLTHPQTVFVRMGPMSYTVFVEPKKETFHYINNRASLFMGANARVNSDLNALNDIRLYLGTKARKKIGETTPEDYKKMCSELREKALNKLADYQKNNSASQKGLQIKKIDLELSFYQELLGYDMYRSSLQRKNKKVKKEADKMPYREFEISKSYYDFLPKDVADNRLYTLSNSYYFFVNRLMYVDLFKTQRNSKLSKVEMADGLLKQGVELTPEELNMVEFSKQIETPEIRAKEANFEKKYGDVEQGFYKKYRGHFKDVSAYLRAEDRPYRGHFILSVVDYFEEKDIEITNEETEMVEALRVLKTPKEIEKEHLFNQKFKDVSQPFYEKFSDNSSDIYRARRSAVRDKKLKAFFEKEDAFMFDVIKMQDLCMPLEDYAVYSDEALVSAQQELNTPFLKNYLALCNEQTKEKIEINKTKGGYTVHNVERTEGDDLFDAMLEKFKGKVVYVDFWATWCGPCKSGIKRVAPLKEMMKDEDVVFLYVTNPSSPEGTWKNAIANIKGEHYRVSNDEWNYLKQKFNISGIPHYTLVDRKGGIVKSKLRPGSNESLKRILKEELDK